MGYKIVFFDIDGTLLNEKKEIPLDTKEAIDKLKEKNIDVVIASGRGPYWIKSVAKELGISSYVSLSGSYVVYKGEVIYDNPIPEKDLSSLEEFARRNNHPLVYLGNEGYFTNHDQHPHIIEAFNSLKLEVPNYSPDFWKGTNIYQVMVYCQSHEEQQYLGNFPSLHFIRWHDFSTDAVQLGESKARGIEAMLNYLNLSPQEAIAFGDALNDREMLSYVGMGIAMGNAVDEVKRCAKLVTKHVNQGGIFYGLKQVNMI